MVRTIKSNLFVTLATVAVMAALLLKSSGIQAEDTFVKGINLNGNAVVIDGHSWTSYSTALNSGFSTSPVNSFSNNITWAPAVDGNTNTMLNTVLYKSAGSFTMNQTLANGNYKLYFWLTENYADNGRSEDIKLEGFTVAAGVGRMAKNTWLKLGPYAVAVKDGVLNIDFVRISGDPQCAGLAIYSTDSVTAMPMDGWSKIKAGNYSSCAPASIQKNDKVLSVNADAKWVQYNNVDFHTQSNYVQLSYANGGNSSGIQLTVGGKSTNTLLLEPTGGWDIFQTRTFRLNTPINGMNDVKLLLGENSINLDWFVFSTENPVTPSVSTVFKNRVIITTDLGADPDDQQSLVRLMVSSNEFDLEGLIVSTSLWKTSQSSTGMLDKIINAYGQVVSNLQKHASGYPAFSYLQSITKMGQPGFGMADVGINKDSPGSELIIAAVDKSDMRPVWVDCWGGANTLAQVLWKISNTRTPAQVNQFVSKLRVYDILGQDDAGAWITKNFPDLFYIRFCGVYGWQPTDSWAATNVQSHGPLGAVYPNRAWSIEGDTPAFLYLYPIGLSDPEHVDWGSWGGCCATAKKAGVRGMTGGAAYDEAQYDPYYMYSDAAEGGNSVSRWSTAIHNDFAARMDWSVSDTYSSVNHHPVAVLNNDTTRAILQVTADAGANIDLNAAGSTDPDGNTLAYSWLYYNEPGTYHGTVGIKNSSSSSATVSIPSDAAGRTIHIILEVHDNGSPNLYVYRRAIITIK